MSDSNPNIIWECSRVGDCCQLFVFTGVAVSESEWHTLDPDIKALGLSSEYYETCSKLRTLPIIGEDPPKKCAFLKDNRCLVYEKRPKRCREYPIMVTETEDSVILHISTDCPRSELFLPDNIQSNPPQWLKEKIKNRKIKIVCESFYEKSMCEYFGEEY